MISENQLEGLCVEWCAEGGLAQGLDTARDDPADTLPVTHSDGSESYSEYLGCCSDDLKGCPDDIAGKHTPHVGVS